jgi:hypothetical protein
MVVEEDDNMVEKCKSGTAEKGKRVTSENGTKEGKGWQGRRKTAKARGEGRR